MNENDVRIITGSCLDVLSTFPAESVNCVVTSPPYWGLRDYGVDGQLGLEKTPDEYVSNLVAVFREVRRVLTSDGTCWLNLGDSYASDFKGSGGPSKKQLTNAGSFYNGNQRLNHGLKPKDLCGIPWRVAFALQADGWYLRQDIIWHKPNPMPESIRDRCTKAHEYIFLLTKSERYWYDPDAISEPALFAGSIKDYTGDQKNNSSDQIMQATRPRGRKITVTDTRNKRSVWSIPSQPYPDAHFATFPEEIPRTCILAGCPSGGTVLDPFAGAGTTGLVARKLGHPFIGIELNPQYAEMARRRIMAIPVSLFAMAGV
jgi:DNA modification methylase